jgi:hypothetical protein
MTDASVLAEEPTERIGPEQGGGPPGLLPWTLVVQDEGWEADLEHGAWLPCVGDRIDFIGDDGRQRAFRVTDVIHTVQRSAGERPPVRAEQHSPNSTVVDGPAGGAPRELRAGLPRVVVTAEG